jgi:hypothetical protein
MKTILMILLTVISSAGFAQKKKNQKEAWQQLFNGHNLAGWDIKIAGQPLNDNYKNTFRVEDGMIRIVYDQYEKFNDKYGHLYFNQPFSFYKLRFEYRFTGNQTPGGAAWNVRNSGVMIHSQSAQSLSFNQHFPVSLEIQTLGGLGKGPRSTANLCTPGTQVNINGQLNDNHCIDSKSKTYDGDQWVKVEALVLGDSIMHIIDGQVVLQYEKAIIGGGFVGAHYQWKDAGIDNGDYWEKRANTPLKEGYIALQAESHPIDFRNIEVLNLKGCMNKKAKNYKSYFVESDPSSCEF